MSFVAEAIEDVAGAVGDVVEGAVEIVGDVVEGVGDVVGDVVEGIGNTVEAVIEDPLPTLVAIAGQAVGIPAYLTMPAITASRGGDLEAIALSAAVGYAAPIAGSAISSTLTSTIGTEIANQAVSNAVVNGVTSGLVNGTVAEIRGGDFQDGFAGGFVGGMVGSGVKDYVKYVQPDVVNSMAEYGISPQTVATGLNVGAQALAAGLTSEMLGRSDFGTAFTNSLITSGIQGGVSATANAVSNAFDQVFDVDRQVQGAKEGDQEDQQQLASEAQVADQNIQSKESEIQSTASALDVLGQPMVTDRDRAFQEEFARYLQSMQAGETRPPEYAAQDLGVTSENFGSFDKNLVDIMNRGGYTSQWQQANGDRVFVNDDGSGIGISEDGRNYALSQEEVKSMVDSGILNTAESGYVAATGGTGNVPGGSAPAQGRTSSGSGILRAAGAALAGTTLSNFGMPGMGLVSPMREPPVKTAIEDNSQPIRMGGQTPAYDKLAEFKGPLDEFLSMVERGSYTPRTQPQQTPQPQTPVIDRLDQPTLPQVDMANYFNYGQSTDIDNVLGSIPGMPMMKAGGMASPLMAAGGGALDVVHHSGKKRLDFRQGAAVSGPGDGQSDDIPAMLADGEFVFPADVVAALGNGSTKAGSDKLYKMMHEIRAYHRSAKPKDLPPPAKKSPLDYLKGQKKGRRS